MTDKSSIRQHYLRTRSLLSERNVAAWSQAITKRLWADRVYRSATSVMLYVSMTNEVGTLDLIRRTSQAKPVFLPRVENGKIVPYLFSGFEDLRRSSFGILEPEPTTSVQPTAIDLVIVPGVCYDRRGYRIGHGKGYYDAFLGSCAARRIGIAFDCQVIASIPVEPWDCKVDRLVTEERIYCDDP